MKIKKELCDFPDKLTYSITTFSEDESKCTDIAKAIFSIMCREGDGLVFDHRVLKPEEIAGRINFLHSDVNKNITERAKCKCEAHWITEITTQNEKERICASLLVELLASAFNANLPSFSFPEARKSHRHLFCKDHPDSE